MTSHHLSNHKLFAVKTDCKPKQLYNRVAMATLSGRQIAHTRTCCKRLTANSWLQCVTAIHFFRFLLLSAVRLVFPFRFL